MAAPSKDDTSGLFWIRRTVMQMLRDRGYIVEEEDLGMNKLQFVEKFGENVKRDALTINKTKRKDPSNQIYVFFPNDAKFGVVVLRPYLERMRQENVMRAIIVIQKNLTVQAKASIQDLSATYRLEIFLEAELLVNVSEHELVPKHILLTNDEKKALLERYTLKETQLPRILVTDPIAKYYGLRRGQVVKIIRKSETAGEYITYRYVI